MQRELQNIIKRDFKTIFVVRLQWQTCVNELPSQSPSSETISGFPCVWVKENSALGNMNTVHVILVNNKCLTLSGSFLLYSTILLNVIWICISRFQSFMAKVSGTFQLVRTDRTLKWFPSHSNHFVKWLFLWKIHAQMSTLFFCTISVSIADFECRRSAL